VEGLAEGIAELCLNKLHVKALTVRVEKPRALLVASSAGVEIRRSIYKEEEKRNKQGDYIFITNMSVRTIIGVNPWEREEKQDVIANMKLWPFLPLEGDYVPKTHNYRTISRTIINFLEESTFQTIEAMVTAMADLLLAKSHVKKVNLYVEKPSALLLAKSAGIEITRESHTNNSNAPSSNSSDNLGAKQHEVYIGLGSNLGDRVKNISQAIKILEAKKYATVIGTSFLYQTPPALVTDQPMFLNAVCKIKTTLSPQDLLKALKEIENELGRTPTIRYGPRVIDLDILFYDDIELKTEELQIPHPALHLRHFVLKPLCDITKYLEHPILQKVSVQLLNHLDSKEKVKMQKVLPFNEQKSFLLGESTLIMGILNVTPDSFSDGGQYLDVEKAVKRAIEMENEGAHIIDVGGMSTRPFAEVIPVEEELKRVLPVIKSLKEKVKIPISIDTYRAAVAKAAVEAGASMINDVTGGSGDEAMFDTMCELDVPVILMHNRGNFSTMVNLKDYPNDDVVAGVRQELGERVNSALSKGIKRWNIVIDPGLGFAKHPAQSFTLLSKLPELVLPNSPLEGFPILAGPSKKGFIGSVLEHDDIKERSWGTAAACAGLVGSGVDIIRVHDVKEMIDVIKVADAIWRRKKD